jgi:hypothetical protein
MPANHRSWADAAVSPTAPVPAFGAGWVGSRIMGRVSCMCTPLAARSKPSAHRNTYRGPAATMGGYPIIARVVYEIEHD